MATFTLTINTDNAAFDDNLLVSELTACADKALQRIYRGETSGNVRDTNGNTVGRFELSED